MTESPATLLVVSHDRRLLETICTKLWVVDGGLAAAFDGGYREWRAAVAAGWTVAEAASPTAGGERHGRALGGRRGASARRSAGAGRRHRHAATPAGGSASPARQLSKDAYRRQKAVVDAELSRLGLRKSHLELAMADPAVASNFVEMRRVTSELVDVEPALATAEDAWLELEERAP